MPSELHLLKRRTISILNTFRRLYPESDIFKDVDADAIKSIDENALNGFHELYLKCQLFKILVAGINEASFKKLPAKGQYLVEMLFNPSMEDDLLDMSKLRSLDDLLFKYKGIRFQDFSPLWDDLDSDQINALKNSIDTYIRWFQINKDTVYRDSTDVIKPDLQQKIIPFMDDDVEQEDYVQRPLLKDESLGTSGLAVCIALVGIHATKTKAPMVEVCHVSSGYYDCLLELHEHFGADRDNIDVYLVGGYPIYFADFLPIIYSNKFNIRDVRLATSTNKGASCVVTSDGTTASVYYSGNLAHTSVKKRGLETVEGGKEENDSKRLCARK